MKKLYLILFIVSLSFVIVLFFSGNQREQPEGITAIDGDYLMQEKNTVRDDVVRTQSRLYAEIKSRFSDVDGKFIGEKNRIVSESLSYVMLTSVLSEDRGAFDKAWSWTKDNLQVRPNDKLFSWLWQNGKVTDVNPATDADQDIAYALYLAYKKWGTEKYLSEARLIVNDVWNIETEKIAGTRYLAAGNWAVNDTGGIVINPSYLAPYQYRIFAQIDPEHDWMQLVDSSYKTLEFCTGTAGLAQDWCKISNQGNAVKNFKLSKNDSSVYSFDAMRVPYRIAMDYALHSEPRALEYLKKNKVFIKDWENNGKIFAVYDQQGGYVGKNESLASYGAQLASMSLINKEIAQEIFEKKIATIKSWENVSFYDMSWLWFGLHFYSIDQ